MRLPSRWVTNPESTLRQRADLIPRSALFYARRYGKRMLSIFDMGRASIGRPPAQGTPQSRTAGNKATRREKKRDARKRKAPKKEGERYRRGYVCTPGKSPRKREERSAGKTVQERRCGKDDAGNTVQYTGEKLNRPSPEQEPRPPRRTTTSLENLGWLPWKNPLVRIRMKTPAGRSRG